MDVRSSSEAEWRVPIGEQADISHDAECVAVGADKEDPNPEAAANLARNDT
jgi:hypothetical protein